MFLFLLNTTITVQYKIYAKLLSLIFIFDVYAKKIIYDAKNYFSVNYQKKLRAYCFPKFGKEFTGVSVPKKITLFITLSKQNICKRKQKLHHLFLKQNFGPKQFDYRPLRLFSYISYGNTVKFL